MSCTTEKIAFSVLELVRQPIQRDSQVGASICIDIKQSALADYNILSPVTGLASGRALGYLIDVAQNRELLEMVTCHCFLCFLR